MRHSRDSAAIGMRTASFIITAVGMAAMGCGHGPRHVTDPDPSDKIPAIHEAVQLNDRTAIPQLIIDLDSDDAAVRLHSIKALRALTGQSFGYNFYDDQERRKAAIEKWRKWYSRQPKP